MWLKVLLSHSLYDGRIPKQLGALVHIFPFLTMANTGLFFN